MTLSRTKLWNWTNVSRDFLPKIAKIRLLNYFMLFAFNSLNWYGNLP